MKGNPPITVLISDVSLGTCWPFSGQKGQIGILIKGITILHVSPVLAYDIRTAPRRFELRGIGTGHAEDLDLLYVGAYDIKAEHHIQYYAVVMPFNLKNVDLDPGTLVPGVPHR
ncbi:hypothetical protein PSTG_09835 [Puccinia striiformis f. sp. tritici PST-78]|uniref:SUN domain-containing protein n=1 Tax=Puccinia striiformis f. sp. tritici PST-78 TaxID=1165861 RepID=A0A0L0VC15_9BASI|nr:hypothetical protein PSTG_09835 [Puccinia striiformis f. sp. tritici PST-78]